MSVVESTRITGQWRRFGRVVGSVPYFTAADWLWAPIPASPVIDANSAAMITSLTAAPAAMTQASYEFGVPVYEIPIGATGIPTYSVASTVYYVRTVTGVPIPDEAAPAPGSDGPMCIIDYRTGKEYEFWQAVKSGSTWSASAIVVYPTLSGAGRSEADTGEGAVGAGVSRLAGLIRRTEITAAWPNGNLGHALVFSTDIATLSVFRYPAVKTDGSNISGASNPIPEGARLQLDPAFDVEGSSLATLQKIFARTAQVYGFYNIDNGGSRMTFNWEGDNAALATPPTDPGSPVGTNGWAKDYGVRWDYDDISPGFPLSQMRILKNWDGSA